MSKSRKINQRWIPGLLLLVLSVICSACGGVGGQPSSGSGNSPLTSPSPAAALQAKLNAMKLINYFPSANGWALMWTNWNPTQINTDFALMASMHVNTVRIIANTPAFGYPTPSSTMLSELSQVITMANNNGLQVQLTLFDFWNSYSDISGSEEWAAAILVPYKSDSRIAFIELQNELSPENSTAMTWAKTMLPYLEQEAGNIPVTVSVTDGAAGGTYLELRNLITNLGSSQPTFYDIHNYYNAPVEDYFQMYESQLLATAQGRPLIVSEVGASTNAVSYTSMNIAQADASYEAWQDYTYRQQFIAAKTLGLPAPAPWILYDFVPGSLTWLSPTPATNAAQYNYGIYKVDGTPKTAAASVSSYFDTGTVDTSFNNGFENYASGVASMPFLWQVFMPNLGNFALDTAQAHSGNASVKIWNSTISSSGNASFYITPVAAIVSGKSYTASVYVRGLNATGTTDICLAWFDGARTYLGQNCGGSLSGTTGWAQVSVTGVAPAGTAYTDIFLSSAGNTGTAWFDDVTFQ